MRFGLIANLKREGGADAVRAFIRWAEETSNELVLCRPLGVETDLEMVGPDLLSNKIDIVVSMGGDGTLLSAARKVGSAGIPVLGINLGSLGFLTQLTPKQLIHSLNAIVARKYQTEYRMLLKAELANGTTLESPYALNDIVIDNGPVSRLIDINLSVNGEEVISYRADGLIIATPTGSTAYSLAVGGPILHPGMEAVVASPISSFSLSTRPMVFSSRETFEISIHSDHDQSGLTLDGQVMVGLTNNDRVKIRRAGFDVKLITFPENSFYTVLKNKLHWGHRPIAEDE
ncbi:MAG: NAD(+)/NADH kinase [bacterium]|nr:NAD(+)/NADH kinase [bacterium]